MQTLSDLVKGMVRGVRCVCADSTGQLMWLMFIICNPQRDSAVRSRQVPKTQCQADIMKYVADSGDNLQGYFDLDQYRHFLSNLQNCFFSQR